MEPSKLIESNLDRIHNLVPKAIDFRDEGLLDKFDFQSEESSGPSSNSESNYESECSSSDSFYDAIADADGYESIKFGFTDPQFRDQSRTLPMSSSY